VPKIRVLVVDDSVVIRRVVTQLLSEDEDLEVVGTAANGEIALAKVDQVSPDIVVLDVDMPEMDGLETLTHLKLKNPELPVIMFSGLTERGADITLEALFRGALDYVTKPGNFSDAEAALAAIRLELIPKIKIVCKPVRVRRRPERITPARTPEHGGGVVDAVVVAASTGGPAALASVLDSFQGPPPVPVLVVQHMPPVFTRYLAMQLATKTGLKVEEGRDGVPVRPGEVWIAPGDHHMLVERAGERVRLRLDRGPRENSLRPAADVLFRSAVRAWGGGVLGMVLTGMGRDGLRGAEAIHQAGGSIVVQDEASSVVWGMPGNIVAGGLADTVLPADELGPWLVARLEAGREGSRDG